MGAFKSYDKKAKMIRMIDSFISKWDGKKDICIYPYGNDARVFKSILNDNYGITEKYILDNYLCTKENDIPIYSLDYFDTIKQGDEIVFLVSDKGDIYSELRNQLLSVVCIDRIIDVLSVSMFFDRDVFWDSSYFQYDNCQYPRFLMLESCVKELYQNNVKGSIVECGVFEGYFATIMRRLMPERKFYLFDTFEGFSDIDIDDDESKMSGDFMERVDFFRHVPNEMQIMKKLPYNDNVKICKGYFPETAIGNKEIENDVYAFVDLDTDLYKPIKAGLEFFWPRLAKGGAIMIDEARCKDLPSARKALVEFCRERHLAFNCIEYDLPERRMKDAVGIITKPQ